MSALEIVRTVAALRHRVDSWRRAGAGMVGLVPTMGALHAGHMALVRAAGNDCARTVVTLFVNPQQFGPNEDFATYPRSEASDSATLSAAGVDLLFAPAIKEMYPPGHTTRVSVGPLGDVLEGRHRPGFFTGVATVVSKLLIQVAADRAYFGEKDFQQLQVIRRLARDLDIATDIVGIPTVREADGLAMSSRNIGLDEHARLAAPALYQALQDLAGQVRGGAPVSQAVTGAQAWIREKGFERVDYLAVVRADDLALVGTAAELEGAAGRVLGAVRLGGTRLIDNIAL